MSDLMKASYSGKRFVFEKAHQLGILSMVLDSPDTWFVCNWVQMLKEGKALQLR